MFRLLDVGVGGYVLLFVLAVLSMWLGYRYSRPSR
jgi:hypothetical protein